MNFEEVPLFCRLHGRVPKEKLACPRCYPGQGLRLTRTRNKPKPDEGGAFEGVRTNSDEKGCGAN